MKMIKTYSRFTFDNQIDVWYGPKFKFTEEQAKEIAEQINTIINGNTIPEEGNAPKEGQKATQTRQQESTRKHGFLYRLLGKP